METDKSSASVAMETGLKFWLLRKTESLVVMATDLKLSGRPANSSDLVSSTSLIRS